MVIGRGLKAKWLNAGRTFIKGKMAAGKADTLSDVNPAAKLAMPQSMAKAIEMLRNYWTKRRESDSARCLPAV